MLDATVLIAGIGWPRWSHEVLRHAARGDFKAVLSSLIVEQARRHLAKLAPAQVMEFDRWQELSVAEMVSDPTDSIVSWPFSIEQNAASPGDTRMDQQPLFDRRARDLFRGWELKSAPPGVDLARMRLGRWQCVRAEMQRQDVDALILIDPINIRYATDARNMTNWTMRTPARYLFLPAAGPVILFEFKGGEHLAAHLETIAEVRTSTTVSFATGAYRVYDKASQWARDLHALITQYASAHSRVGVERLHFAAAEALRAQGHTLVDAHAVLDVARSVLLPDEIACMMMPRRLISRMAGLRALEVLDVVLGRRSIQPQYDLEHRAPIAPAGRRRLSPLHRPSKGVHRPRKRIGRLLSQHVPLVRGQAIPLTAQIDVNRLIAIRVWHAQLSQRAVYLTMLAARVDPGQVRAGKQAADRAVGVAQCGGGRILHLHRRDEGAHFGRHARHLQPGHEAHGVEHVAGIHQHHTASRHRFLAAPRAHPAAGQAQCPVAGRLVDERVDLHPDDIADGANLDQFAAANEGRRVPQLVKDTQCQMARIRQADQLIRLVQVDRHRFLDERVLPGAEDLPG